MKIAVIENEYGAVSIDTALVEENVREVGDGGRHRSICFNYAYYTIFVLFILSDRWSSTAELRAPGL